MPTIEELQSAMRKPHGVECGNCGAMILLPSHVLWMWAPTLYCSQDCFSVAEAQLATAMGEPPATTTGPLR